LQGLFALERAVIHGPHVTDASLARLAGSTKLVRLDLEGTSVTYAGLVHLRGLTNLERLNLSGTQVTDVGLEHVQGLPQLTRLVTGKSVKDPEFLAQREEFLRALGRRIGLVEIEPS